MKKEIDQKDNLLLLEALEDLMYKLSLQLEEMKGGQLSKKRKELAEKQTRAETLQHFIHNSMLKSKPSVD